MRFRRSNSCRAFTLIELMAAVVLMALLTGAAAMTFAHPIRLARARQAIDLVTRNDAMAREEARRLGRTTPIVFDLRSQTIRRGTNAAPLPSGCVIRQLRIDRRIYDHGDVELDVSSLGLSRSYAVHLVGPELDQWLIVAGLSGDVIKTNDESKMEQILASSRDDTR